MNKHPYYHFLFFGIVFLFFKPVAAQTIDKTPFLIPADSLNKTRFWTCLGIGSAIYGSTSVALYHTWYKEYELIEFHTFNDAAEWVQMDKMGHLFTTYTESRIAYRGARWTGIPDQKSRWVGVGVGMLIQSTIEVMDGFSKKWGFSWSDMGFNALGAGFFLGQEALWSDQRIVLKISNTSPHYSSSPIWSTNRKAVSSTAQRASELYGQSFAETFLKDYNGMTIWASINPTSFFPKDHSPGFLPRWLNIAVGYSGANLYGGFENTWEDDAGNIFLLAPEDFPRYRQFYLSLDVDVDRIPTHNPFVRTLLTLVSWIKVPAPSLEINTRGDVKFHPFFW